MGALWGEGWRKEKWDERVCLEELAWLGDWVADCCELLPVGSGLS